MPTLESHPLISRTLDSNPGRRGLRALSRGRPGISHAGHRPTPAPHSRQVNDTPFQNLTREEAVNFLLGLPVGEEVELVTQRKQDSECVCVCVCVCERETERKVCVAHG